jgi:hypothetical protein
LEWVGPIVVHTAYGVSTAFVATHMFIFPVGTCATSLKLCVGCAEYRQVLAAAAAHSVAQTVNPRDVVVAIVGGTMLTLALTRPRLGWVERLTESSKSNRLWAERALTVFAFAMAGYAWTSLYLVLHKQLGSQIDTMLKGAAYFMITYAWLVHFEPFVAQWRLRGWLGAIVFYSGVAIFAASIGVVIAEVLLSSSFTLDNLRFLSITGGLAGAGWLAYRLIPRFEAFLDRVVPTRQSLQPCSPKAPEAAEARRFLELYGQWSQ